MRILVQKVSKPIPILRYSNGTGYSLNWLTEKEYEKKLKK